MDIDMTLQERFNEKFYQDNDLNDQVSGWLGRINPDKTRSIALAEDVLVFVEQEVNNAKIEAYKELADNIIKSLKGHGQKKRNSGSDRNFA